MNPKVNHRLQTLAVIDHAWRIPLMIREEDPGAPKELDALLSHIESDVKFLLACPGTHLRSITGRDKAAIEAIQRKWMAEMGWFGSPRNIQTFIQSVMAIIDDHLKTGAVKYRPAFNRFSSLIYNLDALLAYYRRIDRHHPACVRAAGRAADKWAAVVEAV
jgi:hypothetical protein